MAKKISKRQKRERSGQTAKLLLMYNETIKIN